MIVFLDMDGVLVNFGEGTYRAFGIPYDYATASPDWFYYREWGVFDEEFDSVCDRQFFASLRWLHDGKQILDAIEKRFTPDCIYLLTSPMNNPGSPSGKTDWVLRHLPAYRKRLIITQSSKSLFAGPDRLLIDDRDENAAEFVAAGGRGILVPRPWNELRGWADDTLQVIKNSLEAL